MENKEQTPAQDKPCNEECTCPTPMELVEMTFVETVLEYDNRNTLLSPDELLTLARVAEVIENHYFNNTTTK